jgi:hypothetical protein
MSQRLNATVARSVYSRVGLIKPAWLTPLFDCPTYTLGCRVVAELKFCHSKKPPIVAVIVKAQHDFVFIK